MHIVDNKHFMKKGREGKNLTKAPTLKKNTRFQVGKVDFQKGEKSMVKKEQKEAKKRA